MNLKNLILVKAINHLDSKSKKKYFLYLCCQVALSLLDLLGLVCIGTLAALSISGVQSEIPGSRVARVINALGLDTFSFQNKVAMLALMAMALLITRTLLSILITKRGMVFLSFFSARMARDLVARYSYQDRISILKYSEQEFIMASTRGVYALSIGVLSSAIVIASDASLFLVLAVALFFVDSNLAIVSVIFFIGLGSTLHFGLSKRSKNLGTKEVSLYATTSEKISESLRGYRDFHVRNSQEWQSKRFYDDRYKLAAVQASTTFTPLISKYVLEISVVLGAVLFGAYQFVLKDASAAIASLSIFLAAGIRIAPAVMRIQQSALQLKNSSGVASVAIQLLEDLSVKKVLRHTRENNEEFQTTIELDKVAFKYPFNTQPPIKNASLVITQGQKIGIIGESGSGKSTLIDLILGVINPTSGIIAISGETPARAVTMWPGVIGYVPQEVFILNTTIFDNIVFGFENELLKDTASQHRYIHSILTKLKLDSYVSSLPMGLESELGEHGVGLSGGQRQRIGIARALFTQPKLLVLDEITSALDRDTAAEVIKTISEISKEITIIMISHDPSLMKGFDKIIEVKDAELRMIEEKP